MVSLFLPMISVASLALGFCQLHSRVEEGLNGVEVEVFVHKVGGVAVADGVALRMVAGLISTAVRTSKKN